jgi:hypothetical protein
VKDKKSTVKRMYEVWWYVKLIESKQSMKHGIASVNTKKEKDCKKFLKKNRSGGRGVRSGENEGACEGRWSMEVR